VLNCWVCFWKERAFFEFFAEYQNFRGHENFSGGTGVLGQKDWLSLPEIRRTSDKMPHIATMGGQAGREISPSLPKARSRSQNRRRFTHDAVKLGKIAAKFLQLNTHTNICLRLSRAVIMFWEK